MMPPEPGSRRARSHQAGVRFPISHQLPTARDPRTPLAFSRAEVTRAGVTEPGSGLPFLLHGVASQPSLQADSRYNEQHN